MFKANLHFPVRIRFSICTVPGVESPALWGPTRTTAHLCMPNLHSQAGWEQSSVPAGRPDARNPELL